MLLVIQLINAFMFLVPNLCDFSAQCRNGELINWTGVSSQSIVPLLLIKDTIRRHSNSRLVSRAGSSVDLLEYLVRFSSAEMPLP